MTSRSRLLLALLTVAALASAACDTSSEDEALDFRASVETTPVTRGRIERLLPTTGTVRAREAAKAVSETGGKLQLMRDPATGRRLAIGDAVKKGQVLAIVAADEVATTTRLSSRKQELDAAQADFERHRQLREQGIVSELSLSQTQTRLSTARNEYANAVLQQSKSRVLSPLTGVLTTVTTAVDGEFIAERTVLAEVMDVTELLVDLDLGAGDAIDIQPGLPARVSSPGDDSSVKGFVERAAPAIDQKTRTFRVEVALDEPGSLRPGMFVRVDLVLEAREGVIVVDARAPVASDGGWAVFVVEAQRAVKKPVKLGLVTPDSVEIVEGLGEGALVVTAGQDTLQDSARVIVRDGA